MTIACKLWLLAVVCVAFLYQDGPQGNGVLCVKKNAHSYEDNSFEGGSSDDEYADHDYDNHSGNSSGGGDSDGGGVGKNNEDITVEEYDDSDYKENSKYKTENKKFGKGKNHHHDYDNDDNDDDDSEDNEDEEDGENEKDEEDADYKDNGSDEDDKEHHKHCKTKKKNNNDEIGDLQISTTTTITGKPNDILKFLNTGVKPYKPATLDFKKKSNSKLLKKIESITKSNKSSKGKKNPKEDLTNYMKNLIQESSKKKKSKQVDPDKILITLLKNVLLKLLKET